MPKWCKFIIAVLLLPFCVGSVMALGKVLGTTGRAELVWVPLAAGAACWWGAFLILPVPMRIYVLGHEFTHVVWTWLFGGKVKRFKVSAAGGHVVVTRSNFLICLAPYFFPLYAILVVLGFGVGHWIWGWSGHLVWFHLVIGAAYSFHVTLTWHVLQHRQSDITSQGYLFSVVVILLGNVSVLLIGLPLITAQVSVATSLEWWWNDSLDMIAWIAQAAGLKS